jgi:hypothetical protein
MCTVGPDKMNKDRARHELCTKGQLLKGGKACAGILEQVKNLQTQLDEERKARKKAKKSSK